MSITDLASANEAVKRLDLTEVEQEKTLKHFMKLLKGGPIKVWSGANPFAPRVPTPNPIEVETLKIVRELRDLLKQMKPELKAGDSDVS
jgi:hypothetical protein